jgi:hypothetical protein
VRASRRRNRDEPACITLFQAFSLAKERTEL